jgi:hypothetical protein
MCAAGCLGTWHGNVAEPFPTAVSGSFHNEVNGAHPHSGAHNNSPQNAAKNVVDLGTDSACVSGSAVNHTRNS